MTRRMWRWCLALTGLGLVVGLGRLLPPTVTAQHVPDEGRTVTRLTDGRSVVIGGSGAEGPVAAFTVLSPEGQPLLQGRLTAPRAWHTATVLPDGTILLTGGITTGGQRGLVTERLDPELGQVEPVPAWVTPRARHSATLLPDGRVVLIGGTDDAGLPVTQAELVDPATGTVTPLAALPTVPRSDHTATLLPDGSIRIAGGHDHGGGAGLLAERLMPTLDRFVVDQAGLVSLLAPSVRVWPANGQESVPLDTRVVMQLVGAVDQRSRLTREIRLATGIEAVTVSTVLAEQGRLLFVTPVAPLAAGTTYTLTVPSMSMADGQMTAAFETTFTTPTRHGARGGPPSHAVER